MTTRIVPYVLYMQDWGGSCSQHDSNRCPYRFQNAVVFSFRAILCYHHVKMWSGYWSYGWTNHFLTVREFPSSSWFWSARAIFEQQNLVASTICSARSNRHRRQLYQLSYSKKYNSDHFVLSSRVCCCIFLNPRGEGYSTIKQQN